MKRVIGAGALVGLCGIAHAQDPYPLRGLFAHRISTGETFVIDAGVDSGMPQFAVDAGRVVYTGIHPDFLDEAPQLVGTFEYYMNPAVRVVNVFDLETGTVETIDNVFAQHLSISGDRIYGQTSDVTWNPTGLQEWTAGQRTTIDPALGLYSSTSPNHLAWLGGDGAFGTVYVRDLITDQTTAVYSNPGIPGVGIVGIAVDGNRLVYAVGDGTDSGNLFTTVRHYDLTTGVDSFVETIDFPNVSANDMINLSGDRVTFIKNGEVYVRDIGLGTETIVSLDLGDGVHFMPDIDGDNVVWCFAPDGSPGVDIYRFNLASQQLSLVAGGNEIANIFVDIDGDWIVYDPPPGTEAMPFPALPEPSTFSAVAVAAMIAFQRRRR